MYVHVRPQFWMDLGVSAIPHFSLDYKVPADLYPTAYLRGKLQDTSENGIRDLSLSLIKDYRLSIPLKGLTNKT